MYCGDGVEVWVDMEFARSIFAVLAAVIRAPEDISFKGGVIILIVIIACSLKPLSKSRGDTL